MPNPTCGTCACFSALAKECRANPPQPVVVQGQNGQPLTLGVFPAARETLWCGAWRERPADARDLDSTANSPRS